MRVFFAAVAATAILASFAGAQTILQLWPPGNSQAASEHDTTSEKDELIAGRRVQRLTNVSHPTLAVYPAVSPNDKHSAVIVFPGGGYRILAYDLEGTEVCQWLNTIGVTCAILKYRVPHSGPYPKHSEDLADAQRGVRLLREHAADWQIDTKRVGVLGFSAGGHLAAVLGAHASDDVYPRGDAADTLSARPDFTVLVYPGGIVHGPNLTEMGAEAKPSQDTPPTFLVQAEDDPVHVENTTLYYQALKNANIPAEMHIFAQGGHGYGLRQTDLPITKWPGLVEQWMRSLK